MPIAEKRAAFRKLHESGFFLIPNAWDIGSAVRLERLDFRAIASTSAGAAWAIGKEDGELTLDEALAHLRLLVGATALPVNADFENGFADDPRQTGINAALAAETGVAGLSIEDFNLLLSLGVFNATHMNQAIFAFRRYEDASLSYTGIESHEGLRHYGLFDTVVAVEEVR